MKQKRTTIWVASLSLLLLAACGSPNITLDNPATDDAVTFEFDGNDKHHVDAGKMEQISLSPGSHKLTLTWDKAGKALDTTISVKEGGIVQSGKGNYVVWRQLYGVQTERKTLLNEDWAMVDSTRFFGDFKLYSPSDVYIEKNWTLGLEEELPESRTLFVTNDFKVESKIFREKDFVATYRRMAEQMKEK